VEPLRQSAVVAFEDKLIGVTAAELAADSNGVVLGTHLAENLGVRPGERVTAISRAGAPVSLRVLGLYESLVYEVDSTTVYVNLRRGQALLGLGGTVNALQVALANRDRAEAISRRIEAGLGLDAESWQEGQADRLSLITMITTIMLTVVALTMAIAGMGIATNLITTVSEKAGEIGVLKAMGLSTGRVAAVFFLLSLMLMAIGVTAGDGLAYGIIEALSRAPMFAKPGAGIIQSDTWPMAKSPVIYLVSAGFALVVSGVAGISPAARAARLQPMEIIRNSAG